MKVSELARLLSKLDQNLEVLCYTEDESLATAKSPFLIFTVESADVQKAITSRDEMRAPVLTFTSEGDSRLFAFLNITTVF